MILPGQQIRLKAGFSEENYSQILVWFRDTELIRYVSFARDAAGLKNVGELKTFLAQLENGLVFEIYANEKFVGYTSLSDFVEDKEAEFSVFILDKNSQGKGIGKQVIELMLQYAFHELHLEKVTLETSEFHETALRLYERTGFKRVKTVPNDREILVDGQWLLSGTVWMEILSAEFLKKKSPKQSG